MPGECPPKRQDRISHFSKCSWHMFTCERQRPLAVVGITTLVSQKVCHVTRWWTSHQNIRLWLLPPAVFYQQDCNVKISLQQSGVLRQNPNQTSTIALSHHKTDVKWWSCWWECQRRAVATYFGLVEESQWKSYWEKTHSLLSLFMPFQRAGHTFLLIFPPFAPQTIFKTNTITHCPFHRCTVLYIFSRPLNAL